MSQRRRTATIVSLLGAATLQSQGLAHAAESISPPQVPLAECHDMTLTFEHVTPTSYEVVVQAVVTQPGVFAFGAGHAYFGTSDSTPDPAGELLTSTADVIEVEPGSSTHWTASCIGGQASGTVRTPRPPAPPRVTVSGATTVRATSHRGVRDPLAATAVDSKGRHLAAHCSPAVLSVTAARTTVTCTSAKDSSGRVGTATRVVTVLGAKAQLERLRDSLHTSPLRGLVSGALEAVRHHDSSTAAHRLALVLDELPHAKLSASRSALVRTDVQRVAHVLGRALPKVHTARPGESVWSIVQDALEHKTGSAPTETAIAAGVRLVLAVNPGVLDRHGFLHPGTVVRVPL